MAIIPTGLVLAVVLACSWPHRTKIRTSGIDGHTAPHELRLRKNAP